MFNLAKPRLKELQALWDHHELYWDDKKEPFLTGSNGSSFNDYYKYIINSKMRGFQSSFCFHIYVCIGNLETQSDN